MYSLPISLRVIPFLARRKPSMMNSIIALERLANLIEMMDQNALHQSSWLDDVLEAYSAHSDRLITLDLNASQSLLLRCALISPQGKLSSSIQCLRVSLHNHDLVLTQTDVVEKVLLPKAEEALLQSDSARLEFVCNVSIRYMESLEREYIEVCAALECLILSLLWRLGRGYMVLGIVRCRLRNLRCATENSYLDKYGESRVGSVAKILIVISGQVELGVEGRGRRQ